MKKPLNITQSLQGYVSAMKEIGQTPTEIFLTKQQLSDYQDEIRNIAEEWGFYNQKVDQVLEYHGIPLKVKEKPEK